jgi:hypothetical protein
MLEFEIRLSDAWSTPDWKNWNGTIAAKLKSG